MNSRHWLAYVILFLVVTCATLCEGTSLREKAEFYGAMAKVKVSIVNDDSIIVSNANVEVYFGMTIREGKTVKGMSDGMGNFTTEGKTTGEIYINVRKKGFYHSMKKIELFADKAREVIRGRWMPEVISCQIVLREIHNPTTLITSGREKGYKINEPRVWMGFDIEKNDWVSPYGGGATTDFEVMYDSDGKKLFDYTGSALTIRFVRPFDGAYMRHKNRESDFQTDFEAQTNGCYQTRLEYSERKIARGRWSTKKLSEEQFLVLRVRSQVDEEGRFNGAHYGMILGPMSFGWDRKAFGFVGLHTFFNATFNDTSLERKSIYNTPNFGTIGGFK